MSRSLRAGACQCYGRRFGSWPGSLWRSSNRMLWEELRGMGRPAVALELPHVTYAGRKIFLLSPTCPKRCAVQVSGCGRGEHVALASSWGLPMLWEEIRELAGFAVAFEQPYVMGGTSGDGQARCGARATTCYGRSSGSWRGPLWRSSLRP